MRWHSPSSRREEEGSRLVRQDVDCRRIRLALAPTHFRNYPINSRFRKFIKLVLTQQCKILVNKHILTEPVVDFKYTRGHHCSRWAFARANLVSHFNQTICCAAGFAYSCIAISTATLSPPQLCVAACQMSLLINCRKCIFCYNYCSTQKHKANRKRFLPVTFLRQETDLCWAADRNRPSWRHAVCYQSSLVRSLPRNVSHPYPNNYHSFKIFIQKLLLFNKFRGQCFFNENYLFRRSWI